MNLIEKINSLRQSLACQLMQAQQVIQAQAALVNALQNEVDALTEENTNLLAQLQEFRGRGIAVLQRKDG